MQVIGRSMIKTTNIDTPLGRMTAGATKDGICLLEFSGQQVKSSVLRELKQLLLSEINEGRNRHLRQLKKQLKEYFAGKRKEFSLPLVTPGTEFQMAVWDELRKIPYGTTITYHDQARALKNPRAVRAVGRATSMNRIAIIIPCHRVIGSDGHLIGYGGGLDRKKWLLDHEKKFSGKPVDISLF